jgi:hypothetical protein
MVKNAPEPNKTHLNVTDFAKQYGKSRRWITQLITDGVLVKDENGLLNCEKSKCAITSHFGEVTSHISATTSHIGDQKGEHITKAEADRQRSVWNARLAEIECRHKSGELIEVSTAKKITFDASRLIRDQLLSMPATLSRELAGKDFQQVRDILDAYTRQILDDFDKSLDQLRQS